jgi:hypothetical protein
VRADPLTLTAVFGKDVRYIVPMFQRPYVWNMKEHWEPLWDDIRGVAERVREATLEATAKGTQVHVPPHFLGAIVLELMPTGVGELETRSVIDGQQRLTTLQVFIAAAKAVADGLGLEQQGRLLGKLILNDRDLIQESDHEFKVWPTNSDRDSFRALMRDEPLSALPPTASMKLGTAMQYFRSVLQTWANGVPETEQEAQFTALVAALRGHLKVVGIDLDQEDNAQVIFETLNARGTPLQAADLIKNLLFQRADTEGSKVEALYEKHWAPFDQESWRQEIRQGRLMRPVLDVFLSHWLAMVKERETLIHQLFPAFRDYVSTFAVPAADVMADLSRSAGIYIEMQRYPRRTAEGEFFRRQALMDTTTTVPLLLYIFRLGAEELSGVRRARALKVLESYLVRRMLCRLTSKGYNRTFLDLLVEVKKRPSAADDVFIEFFQRQRGESQSWPSDGEVRDSLLSTPLYTALPRRRVRLLLEALEQAMRTDLSENAQPDEALTIEHLLPQDWKQHWPLGEGVDPEVGAITRDKIKHTLGNLTLVTGKLNSKESNARWTKKKAALSEHSVLRLNWRIMKEDPAVWDEESIAARGAELAELALQIWPGPDSVLWKQAPSTSASRGSQDSPAASPESLSPRMADTPKTDADLVRKVIESRATGNAGRMLAEALISELQSWSEVRAAPGETKNTEDGLTNYIMLHRRKSGVGAFIYMRPKADHVRLTFRLPREYADERPNAFAADVAAKNVYQVRMRLKSLEDLPEALDLALAAFENAGS